MANSPGSSGCFPNGRPIRSCINILSDDLVKAGLWQTGFINTYKYLPYKYLQTSAPMAGALGPRWGSDVRLGPGLGPNRLCERFL